MHNYLSVRSMNLEEDLKSLGIEGLDEMVSLSQATVNEEIAGAIRPIGYMDKAPPVAGDEEPEFPGIEASPEPESVKVESFDPIDGPMVTRELLQRIVNLPLDQLGEEDLDDLINALAEKALPDGDEEIAGMTEEVVTYLFERRQPRRTQAGVVKTTKRTKSKKRLQNKRAQKKPKTKRAKNRRNRRRAAGKISKAEKKTARRHGKTNLDIMRSAKGML